MCVLDKILRARANYSGALLSILHAFVFCLRVFVKFKSSGTVGISSKQELVHGVTYV